ncbi:MAG: PKD-like domain-containing protein [Mangrovibacterium sp.]
MKKLFFSMTMVMLLFAACEDTLEDKTPNPPTVSLAYENGLYEVKVGKTITIAPKIEGAINPYCVWKMDGKIVSQDSIFEFSSKTVSSNPFTFEVYADNGDVVAPGIIEVLELAPPKITLTTDAEGYIQAYQGQDLEITPKVMHGDTATYLWTLLGEEVSTEATYLFGQEDLGDYPLTLLVKNEDGEDYISAIVKVNPAPVLAVIFPQDEISAAVGNKLVLAPSLAYATENTSYVWEVDGVDSSTASAMLAYTPESIGEHVIKLTATEGEMTATATITIQGVSATNYFRAATESSSNLCNTVFEFLPGPGQYVNEGYTCATQEQANAYALGRLKAGAYISLGAFGGYLTVGFDHSIENTSGADLAIKGNAFTNSSEPAVVWVMQDENGNGLPDETWYELKGSETGKSTTKQNFFISYLKPTGSRQNVTWIDAEGKTGTVDINAFHSQDSFFPNWITSASYTLYGTCLPSQVEDQSGNGTYYVNPDFDWGYADNVGSDYISTETQLELDNAIYPDGTSKALTHVDFVKIQVAINSKAGWLGELSTEVLAVRDMSMSK